MKTRDEITHSASVGNLRFIYWSDRKIAVITAPDPNNTDVPRMAIACWDVPGLTKSGGRFLKFVHNRPFHTQVDPRDFMIVAKMGQTYIDKIKERRLEDKCDKRKKSQ